MEQVVSVTNFRSERGLTVKITEVVMYNRTYFRGSGPGVAADMCQTFAGARAYLRKYFGTLVRI